MRYAFCVPRSIYAFIRLHRVWFFAARYFCSRCVLHTLLPATDRFPTRFVPLRLPFLGAFLRSDLVYVAIALRLRCYVHSWTAFGFCTFVATFTVAVSLAVCRFVARLLLRTRLLPHTVCGFTRRLRCVLWLRLTHCRSHTPLPRLPLYVCALPFAVYAYRIYYISLCRSGRYIPLRAVSLLPCRCRFVVFCCLQRSIRCGLRFALPHCYTFTIPRVLSIVDFVAMRLRCVRIFVDFISHVRLPILGYIHA